MERRAVLLGFTIPTLVLLSAGIVALWHYPFSIREDSERIAAGRPYCLAVPGEHRPVVRWWDMTLLVARGNWLRQHLTLYVEGSEGTEGYHWSYSDARFNPEAIGIQHCLPRADFLNDLSGNSVGFFLVLDGEGYVIPPEFEPGHVDEDFIGLDFGLRKNERRGGDHVEIGSSSIERWRRHILKDRPELQGKNESIRSDGVYGFSINDFDAQSLLIQEFRCLHGKNLCVLEFVAPPGLFHVAMEAVPFEDVPAVRARIIDMWQGFSLPQ